MIVDPIATHSRPTWPLYSPTASIIRGNSHEDGGVFGVSIGVTTREYMRPSPGSYITGLRLAASLPPAERRACA